METKVCCKCKIEKSYSDFNISKRNKSGIRGECRDCQKLIYLNKSEYYKEKRKQRYLQNPKKELSRNRKYYENKKSQIIETIRNKKKSDEMLRVSSNLRSRISQFVKSNKLHKDNKTLVMLGIDLPNFKKYLEEQFKPGMCWGNYGKWHIDHIIPLFYAKTTEDLNKLCHYTNLQPLWGIENSSKRNKIITIV
jgi:hypothetical protein